MPFMSDRERTIVSALASLADLNPFGLERVEREREALGDRFDRTEPVWHADADLDSLHPNVPQLELVAEELAPGLRDRLVRGEADPTRNELLAYEGFVRYLLFQRYEAHLFDLIAQAERGEPTTRPLAFYKQYRRDYEHFLSIPGLELPVPVDPAHYFAWGFQVRRAFHHTFRQIYGGSMAAAKLRAAAWQSIFTHDLNRYRRSLYSRMHDFTTLIVGESGTGKELAARAIGLSRYIPFDEKRRAFTEEFTSSFHALNLSALSPTLIESELFGHQRGSFTGAIEDRAGWLEVCPPNGTVFLDEIGELDGSIQVKLLRVLQTRRFQRIGESRDREFQGKIIAATNRDLTEEMRERRFRPDFYYRLCADVIRTPTLREQLADAPDELRNLLQIISWRIVGPAESEGVADEVVTWIDRELGREYPWPGNVRELEQCVRNVLIRGEYRPAGVPHRTTADELCDAVVSGSLSADELLRQYTTRVYAQAGSYEEAARRLGLDRRTVKAKTDPELLERIKNGS